MKPIIGTVISNKMNKAATIIVDRIVVHPIYKKRLKIKKKFHAHDDLGVAIGQKVKIQSCRPISKTIKYKIIEIIK